MLDAGAISTNDIVNALFSSLIFLYLLAIYKLINTISDENRLLVQINNDLKNSIVEKELLKLTFLYYDLMHYIIIGNKISKTEFKKMIIDFDKITNQIDANNARYECLTRKLGDIVDLQEKEKDLTREIGFSFLIFPLIFVPSFIFGFFSIEASYLSITLFIIIGEIVYIIQIEEEKRKIAVESFLQKYERDKAASGDLKSLSVRTLTLVKTANRRSSVKNN